MSGGNGGIPNAITFLYFKGGDCLWGYIELALNVDAKVLFQYDPWIDYS